MLRFLVAVMVAGAALANGVVSGVVADPTGALIPGVSVRLVHEGQTETAYRGVTDAYGAYAIVDVVPGKYILRADHDGFRGRGKSLVVMDSATTDAGSVVLRVSCDAPGASCLEVQAWRSDEPAPPPPPAILARAGFYLHPGCRANLEKGAEECSGSANGGDLQLERRADGSIYLKPVDHARILDCDTRKAIDPPARLDGLAADNEWYVETNAGHDAHLFLSQRIVEPGADDVRLWVVTRKSAQTQ